VNGDNPEKFESFSLDHYREHYGYPVQYTKTILYILEDAAFQYDGGDHSILRKLH
jgi:hypothetical protein